MPSLFGKTHLYRYDIQGGAKSHFLVFVHLPCLQTRLIHFHSSSLTPIVDYDQQIIECLMEYNSLTRDCINYLLQRLQIRDINISASFGLSYFNKINSQSYWLDPDLSMRQQLPKSELKPNLTFTILLYPPVPYSIVDDRARSIVYQQIFCNFIASVYVVPTKLIDSLLAYFLRGCFGPNFHAEKNNDLIPLLMRAVGLSSETNVEGMKERIIQAYRDLNGIDVRSAQNQFVHQISQLNTYGMEQLELRNTLNETICLGLNHHGIHSRSLLRSEFKLEACWHNVTSILSNKQRQITVTMNNGNHNFHTLVYYTDSSNYNRYCVRLLHLFRNQFANYSIEIKIVQKPDTPPMAKPPIKKARLVHGASVPDLRSDGESSSDDRTPNSASSSTRSSNNSSNVWTGSLPNLTVQLTTPPLQQLTTTNNKKNDVYATFADNLNRATDKVDTMSPILKKELSPRRSLPIPYQSRSPMLREDGVRRSPTSVLSSTTTSRTLLNSRTYLSSTSVPLEVETVSIHDDTPTDSWLADLESKLSTNAVYDEFDSIALARIDSSTQDGRHSENVRRNRYADVIPYDDTRVRLIPHKDNLHGYINASHIKVRVANTIYSYIAAEAPLSLTVHDFWRMISGSNVHVIVMLLGHEPQLCANYFPKTKNDVCRTGEFEIELISEQSRQDFIIRHLRMRMINGQRTRTIVHLQYTTWDDAQLPLSTSSFIDFVNVANTFRRHFGETNPCLVHCTAGIGRTGIFILVHVMIQCITFNKKVSVASVLKVMREHRMSLVDRTYAYVFVYRCLIDYLKSSRLI